MNHLKTNLFISSNEQIYLKDISCVIAPQTHFLGFTFNTVPGKTPVQCNVPEHNEHACSMHQNQNKTNKKKQQQKTHHQQKNKPTTIKKTNSNRDRSNLEIAMFTATFPSTGSMLEL